MYKPPKKRLKRLPLLPPPPTKQTPAVESDFEQPLVEASPAAPPPPTQLPPPTKGHGRARAKKLGKKKLSAIARKIDRMRWNTKKKRSY